ncbi:succinylglutamate desuccinylase/aspartoacylase family protein [Flagellimonas pacifica]|uniref:Succinylglutamate desuccinylase n=1 Tax=Flagellimonas pacifica TaxID=1247520 RepID=A0A285N048_9FLAO|nr:succinylglutamate desuccinylase/aspartoacylase family protein [Allomuricauda parva]SNZ01131.1 Succinylglutamate desuccinylase [Allomuricauda parva]
MLKNSSSQLDEGIKVERMIGRLQGSKNGPTLVFFAGIHGNEHAGVVALKQVMQKLQIDETPIHGEIYAIAGNLKALEKNVRFQTEDLNRIWLPERIAAIQSKNDECSDEEIEMLGLYNLLCEILENGEPPFYFIDLHTTSSDTLPFIVLNDSLLNRKFASKYPMPIILGIEEYLVGALLSYINDLGYVSLGYESGQHDDPKAIENCLNFINYTLLMSDSISLDGKKERLLEDSIRKLAKPIQAFYEIYFQYQISSECKFKMLPGFVNFQQISKGTKFAHCNETAIIANRKRQMFMPLYQNQGSEGFYFIRPISKILLWLSKKLRTFKADHLLVRLPGIRWKSGKKDTLIVDQRIARFMAKSFFHLLGYRARQYNETHLVVKSREEASKTAEYFNTSWFMDKKRGPY